MLKNTTCSYLVFLGGLSFPCTLQGQHSYFPTFLPFPTAPCFTSSPSHFRLRCRLFWESWVLGHNVKANTQ